jgi:hypothetical protein
MSINDDSTQTPKRPFYRRPIGIITIVVAVFMLLGIIGSASGSGDDTQADGKPTTTASKTVETPEAEPDPDGDGVRGADDAFPDDATEWDDNNGNGIGDIADDDAKAEAEQAAEAKAEAAAKRRAERRAAAVKRRVAAAKQQRIDNASAPTERQWAQVVKDPDAHIGEYYRVYAQITQFDAATGDDTFLADSANRNTMSYGYFDGENSMFTGGPRQLAPYVEDDLIVATVEVDGSFDYDTQAGGNTTVPLLKVHKITRG